MTMISQPEKIEHRIVAALPGRFAGWPANNGLWQWDGREILVGFSDGAFVEQPGHNIEGRADSAPNIRSLLARSVDAGRSWSVETPHDYVAFHAEFQEPPGDIRFNDPGFAMRVVGIGYHGTENPRGGFYVSDDRGRTWRGAFHFGDLMDGPPLQGLECTARTAYLVTGSRSCLLFLSARPAPNGGGRDKAFCAETTDGGRTFRFVSWIVPLDDPHRAVMPAVTRLPDGRLVAALRRRIPGDSQTCCWIDVCSSADEGRTWSPPVRVGETGLENGNPPALETIGHRLCCVYGDRSRAQLLARYSEDGGATWGEESVLRDDFQPDRFGDRDFGYPRLTRTADGRLLAIYYWATADRPQQHIAATLWRP